MQYHGFQSKAVRGTRRAWVSLARTGVLFAALVGAAAPGAAAPDVGNYGRAPDIGHSSQDVGPESAIVQAIDFEQKLGDRVPLDATFVDEAGQKVQLKEFFGKKPVILTLVYYECPMLCTEVLNGLLQSMKEMNYSAGREFDVVTISIDPRETPDLALKKKIEYMHRYGRDEASSGWHFLVGQEADIKRVADSVGYKYIYDSVTGQYAHPSGIVVITPEGQISHYFFGVQYNSRDVRLGLVEASASKVGSPVDKLLLYCYHYDPLSGKYNLMALNFVRLFGVVTVVLIVGGITLALWRERARKARLENPGLSVQ